MTEAFESCSARGAGSDSVKAGRGVLLLFMLGCLRLSNEHDIRIPGMLKVRECWDSVLDPMRMIMMMMMMITLAQSSLFARHSCQKYYWP